MHRFTLRTAAAAATVLLAAGCSGGTGGSDTTPEARKKETPSAPEPSGLRIAPGKDLLVHQGVAVAALDRSTLQVRGTVSVPEPVAKGLLAGTSSRSRVFDTSFQYGLLGSAGMGADDPNGTLKIADLHAAGTPKAVLSITREQLNAAGATGTISGAQFSTSSDGGPQLWFQTTPVDSPAPERWNSSNASTYKVSSLWSVNIKDWQAGRKAATKHEVPAEVQEYWRSKDCQTAFSRSAGQESHTPWACWIVDATNTPIASGPSTQRTVRGTADTGWKNPAKSSAFTEKVSFSFLKGTNGTPASPVSAGGAGGNSGSTLDGKSGLIDSGTASAGERRMWRFTTAGTSLTLTPLSTVLPTGKAGDSETTLWSFPDGHAVAKVKEGESASGWILTKGSWKDVGTWPAEIQDADVEPTA